MADKLPQNNDREYYLFALRIAGDFGATIALPLVILVLIGKSLDAKFNQGTLFTLLGFVLAALISGIIIYRKAKNYGLEYQKLVDKKIK